MANKAVETCHAETDGPCDCEEYTPSPPNPSKCEECGHGKSKHPKRSTANFSEAKTVSEIFKKIAASVLPDSASSVSFDAAHKDVMKGFKDSFLYVLEDLIKKGMLLILIIQIISNTD